MPDYQETLTIDACFGIDEEHKLFRFIIEGCTEILPVCNIESCMVMADWGALNKNLFHDEEVIPGLGKIPFINDMREFSKAVSGSDVFLTIHFQNNSGNLKIFKKRYSHDDSEVRRLASKINNIVNSNPSV